MPLRKLLKVSTPKLRPNASPAKTPSPEHSFDALIVSTTTSVQPLPTIMSPSTISTPSPIGPPSPSMITSTRASEPFATPLTTPSRATTIFDSMSSPISSPLTRDLHKNIDRQRDLSCAFQSREAEIDKTREQIAEMMKPGRVVEGDQQTKEKWLAHQERWIRWLKKDVEKVREEFYTLEAAEHVLRGRIKGKVGMGLGEMREVLPDWVEGEVEVLPKVLGELRLEEKGKEVEVTDGEINGREQNGGDDDKDEKLEGQDVEEGVDRSGS
ncbi:hypothetical protein MMC18_004780 [Xylographa bjoerkii]|nr:hypothetical protein [Xylographa bjoerkii]